MKLTSLKYHRNHGGYSELKLNIDGTPRVILAEQKPTLIRHGIVSVLPCTKGEKATLPDGGTVPYCIADTKLFRYVVAFLLDVRAGRFEPGQTPDPSTIKTPELIELAIDIEPTAMKNSKPFLEYFELRD